MATVGLVLHHERPRGRRAGRARPPPGWPSGATRSRLPEADAEAAGLAELGVRRRRPRRRARPRREPRRRRHDAAHRRPRRRRRRAGPRRQLRPARLPHRGRAGRAAGARAASSPATTRSRSACCWRSPVEQAGRRDRRRPRLGPQRGRAREDAAGPHRAPRCRSTAGLHHLRRRRPDRRHAHRLDGLRLLGRGPIVAPRHRALLLTPVSPHMLFDRRWCSTDAEVVPLEVAATAPATLSVDGRTWARSADGDAIVCTAADQPARLVTFGARDFLPDPEGQVRPGGPLTVPMLVELPSPTSGSSPTAPRPRAGHDRAHRRDRRGQDDAWSRPSSCWSAAGPTRCSCGPGRSEARVEGRFVAGRRRHRRQARTCGASEVVLARVVPAGRSRAYVDGRLATVAALAELGGDARRPPRPARPPVAAAPAAPARRARPLRRRRPRARCARPGRAWPRSTRRWPRSAATSGAGPARSTCCASRSTSSTPPASTTPTRTTRLEAEEDLLADAAAHREAAADAADALRDDGGAADALARAVAALAGRRPFADVEARLRSVAAELDDLAAELRAGRRGDRRGPRAPRARPRAAATAPASCAASTANPGRRDRLPGRRAAPAGRARVPRRAGARSSRTSEAWRSTVADEAAAAVAQPAGRRRPRSAAAVERHLHELAMPRARFEVEVDGDDPGDDVDVPARPPTPAGRPAAGQGGLGRRAGPHDAAPSRLGAHRDAGPPTLVFDEVDAGIGGEAALAVGRALAALGGDHQVLVVTHLPQVAAFADAQVAVTKVERDGRTVADVRRPRAGRPGGRAVADAVGPARQRAARDHAAELLATATASRRRGS